MDLEIIPRNNEDFVSVRTGGDIGEALKKLLKKDISRLVIIATTHGYSPW
jgi:hypothetical protein